jgi:hypothetical protein
MGAGSSTVTKEVRKSKSVNYYRPPQVRQKDRYDREENTTFTSQHDASIDKVSLSQFNYNFRHLSIICCTWWIV